MCLMWVPSLALASAFSIGIFVADCAYVRFGPHEDNFLGLDVIDFLDGLEGNFGCDPDFLERKKHRLGVNKEFDCREV